MINYKDIDLGILIPALFVSFFGIVNIFSAVYSGTESDDKLWIAQLIRLAFALIAMLISMVISYRFLHDICYVLYGLVSILLMIILLLPEQLGTKRWILSGAIQPSEFARLILIVTVARYISDHKDDPNKKVFFIASIMVLLYTVLIFLQPSLGYALTIIPIAMTIFYVGGLDRSYLTFIGITILLSAVLSVVVLYKGWDLSDSEVLIKFILILIIYISLTSIMYYLSSNDLARRHIKQISICLIVGSVLALLSSVILKDYQKARLIAFVNPNADPSGSGYHIIQSKIAIGSGGLLGQKYLHGTQNRLDFLPAQHTDFIFSVAAEEWGFIGSLVILSAYFTLIMNGLKIAAMTKDLFETLVATGIVSMFITQVVLNIGVTIGLMPITGVPLPFMSYGGSSLLVTFIATGLLLNLKMKR